MTLRPNSETRSISGVTPEQLRAIKLFMQGAIYCWVKNRKGKEFRVRDLMGGENFSWEGTPLQVLYDNQVRTGRSSEESIAEAGKDLGWIVKDVLVEDKRTFKADHDGWVATYRWIGGEP